VGQTEKETPLSPPPPPPGPRPLQKRFDRFRPVSATVVPQR